MAKKGLNIYKRKDGRWEGRYIKNRGENDKPEWGYLYASNYREIEQLLLQTEQLSDERAIRNPSVRKSDFLFETVAFEWLAFSKIEWRESTYIRYANLLQTYLLPTFQNRAVSALRWQDIESLCVCLRSSGRADQHGLSEKTVSDILSVLRRILHYAQANGINVDTAIFNVEVKRTVQPLRILSIGEQRRLQCYLSSHIDSLNLGILVCLYTGIRIGELCALQWHDISLTEKTLYIHQTLQRVQKPLPGKTKTHVIVTPPKSPCSNRVIPIPCALLHEIKKYPLERTGYFLTGSFEKKIEPRTVQYRFKKVLANCQIDDVNFHILRHTFATRCVEANVEIKTLSEILGHSNVSITMNRYVHPSLEMKRLSMDKFSQYMSVK